MKTKQRSKSDNERILDGKNAKINKQIKAIQRREETKCNRQCRQNKANKLMKLIIQRREKRER